VFLVEREEDAAGSMFRQWNISQLCLGSMPVDDPLSADRPLYLAALMEPSSLGKDDTLQQYDDDDKVVVPLIGCRP
jgi:hypothetical protein